MRYTDFMTESGNSQVNGNCPPATQDIELNIQQLATISDEALDNAYHYGRSTPGNSFGWQANLKSAAYARHMIDKGVTDIEAISDAIHKGWNVTAEAFVQNPAQFSDTEKLQAAGKLEAKLQQRAELMKQNYAQLPEEEKEKDRVVARALLQAVRGQQGMAEGLNEGLAHPVIVVDVQPAYAGLNDGDESSVLPQIINFVNKQTGPVLMFVNAEDQGLSGDTIQDIKQYWDDTICPEEERYTHDEETDDYIENPNCPRINWQRFAIVDKGYGYFRSWMDHGIEPDTIIATIRELYQQKKSDSRDLQFPAFNKRTSQQSLIMGAMQEMNDDPISVNWTSVAQLKRFNGAYIVGGARDQCLREVELLMNAFNIKYKRIDTLIYEGQQGVAEGKQPGKSVTDAIQKVLPIAQEIWFHGSRATGKHRRNSDTDILVVIPDEIVGAQYLAVVLILQKLSSDFVNYDIQPTHADDGIYRVAQEEGQLLWSNKQNVVESWSEKYKHSINCSNPKGFSQRAHCAGKKNNESRELLCPHCDGELVSEELMLEKHDACYYKVKSRYNVWPSAYASGALVTCRKKGVKNWGAKNESSILTGMLQVDENLKQWFKEKWVRFGPDGKIRGECARGDDSEGKPKCLPQSKAHSLGKKGRASAAARKRRQDPNPDRSGTAINVNTNKKPSHQE